MKCTLIILEELNFDIMWCYGEGDGHHLGWWGIHEQLFGYLHVRSHRSLGTKNRVKKYKRTYIYCQIVIRVWGGMTPFKEPSVFHLAGGGVLGKGGEGNKSKGEILLSLNWVQLRKET